MWTTVVNLFDKVGSELDYLTTTIVDCLDKPQAVLLARQMFEGTPAALVLDGLN